MKIEPNATLSAAAFLGLGGIVLPSAAPVVAVLREHALHQLHEVRTGSLELPIGCH